MVLCLNERAGEERCWQVCAVSGVHLFLFQRCRYPVRVTEPQTNQCKPWLCCGCAVGLAKQLAKGWGIVPLWCWNTCAYPDTAKLCFGGRGGWFREGRKTSVVGEVQLQVSAANLSYIFLFLKRAFYNLWIFCRSCPGSVLFDTLKYASLLPLPRNCYCIWTIKTWFCSASHYLWQNFLCIVFALI